MRGVGERDNGSHYVWVTKVSVKRVGSEWRHDDEYMEFNSFDGD